MALSRTVNIARTAYDLHHGNRLHVPRYGVLYIYLSIGSKNSKSHLIPEAPKQKQAAGAANEFHFAPEKEKPKIKYELDDKSGCITKVTLELFHRDKKDAIWKKELKDDELNDGKHEIEWDGKIDKGTDFPEEYITVEHSPYKLKLTVEGEKEAHNYSPAAWTFLHVLVHSIELEMGVIEAVSRQLDKDLFGTLALPAEKGMQKINLISNLYSTGNADKGDDTSFTAYRDLWKAGSEEGPNVPIFAKLFVKSSTDTKEEVLKAIGKVRLLWDWTDVAEDLSIHFKQAKEFLTDALNYDKKGTKPNGDNCHKDRGGKRGDDSKPVFPARGGYAEAATLTADTFPFKVEQCATRKWSSYSETWRTGKLMGMTGVSFQPSHMAGDTYIVDAYFPHNRKPDGKDDLDDKEDKQLKHAIKSKPTGKWQVWREIHISLYQKKDGSISNLNFTTIGTTLAKAYIDLVDKSGGAVAPMGGYDGKIRAHLAGQTAERLLTVKAGDQGTITKGGIIYITRSAFKSALEVLKGISPADADTWMGSHGMGSVSAYNDVLEEIADDVVVKTCNEYFNASDGIKVFHLEPYWETDGGSQSTTGGFASVKFGNINRQKAGYIQGVLTPPPSVKEIASHEIGHTLFLPHAPGDAGGPQAPHDNVSHWKNCMMSYEFDKEMKFCGLCLLRLRGWDYTVLKSDRSLNKK